MTQEELDKLSGEYWQTYHWLEEYDNQVKQYERAKRLEVDYTPSEKMEYKSFPELDNLAVEKAKRLKELKTYAYISYETMINLTGDVIENTEPTVSYNDHPSQTE